MKSVVEQLLEQRYYRDAELYATWVGENWNVVCRTCRKPILLGPAFYYNGMYFHISCLNNVPTNHKALLLHFSYPKHGPFIFTEEVKNDGKEDVNVVCFGCEKPVSGAGYKCSTSHCNLLLHKSCLDLPLSIEQHPFHHPCYHTLSLVKPQKKLCNACGKNCNAYPFYHCTECDFNLHFTCATTHSQINVNTDHDCQHTFISLSKHFQFTCEACGEEGKFASQCSTCQLLVHTKCAGYPRIIQITSHDHSLTLTYSFHQVEEHNRIFCNLCYQKVKTKYGAYYCKECNYVAHMACAFKYEEDVDLKLLREELETNVMEVEGAGQIQHFSHQHDLILSNKDLVDDKLCDGCTGLISTPFYSCALCDFFLHSRCAQLQRNKRYPLHPHSLTLFRALSDCSLGSLSCDACQRLNNGFVYACGMCSFKFDIQCCSIPETLNHEGHQHSLFLAINSNRRCSVCNFTSNDKPCVLVCTSCNFALGFECATLPLVARHKDDNHLLKLTYSAEACCEEYYCLICEKKKEIPNNGSIIVPNVTFLLIPNAF